MNSSMWWGIVLIVVGVLFFLDRNGYADFGDLVATFWPLLLVFFGAQILLRKPREQAPATNAAASPRPASGHADAVSGAGSVNYSSVLGDYRMQVDSKVFSGGSVSAVFGDIEIDLSRSELSDGDHTLTTSGVFGTTRITLNPDMEFLLSSNTILGELELGNKRQEGLSPTMTFQSPGFAGATKKLRIIASQVFGDVVVRN